MDSKVYTKIIEDDVRPKSSNVLWLDAKDNQLKKKSNGEWKSVNNDSKNKGNDALTFSLGFDFDRRLYIKSNRELTENDVVSFVSYGRTRTRKIKFEDGYQSHKTIPHYIISEHKSTHPKHNEIFYKYTLEQAQGGKYLYNIWYQGELGSDHGYLGSRAFVGKSVDAIRESINSGKDALIHFKDMSCIKLCKSANPYSTKLYYGISINGIIKKITVTVRNYYTTNTGLYLLKDTDIPERAGLFVDLRID